MYDLDAIEAINIDQLVTPLDRILLRNGRPARRPSRPTIDLTAAVEKTLYMRAQRASSKINVFTAAAFATIMSVTLIACLLA